MLDRLSPDYFDLNGSVFADANAERREDGSRPQSSELSREDNLKRREGKSATRTVKQAMVIKHSKSRKQMHD